MPRIPILHRGPLLSTTVLHSHLVLLVLRHNHLIPLRLLLLLRLLGSLHLLLVSMLGGLKLHLVTLLSLRFGFRTQLLVLPFKDCLLNGHAVATFLRCCFLTLACCDVTNHPRLFRLLRRICGKTDKWCSSCARNLHLLCCRQIGARGI